MSFNDNMGPVVSGNSHLGTVFHKDRGRFKVGHLNCRSIRPSFNSFKLDEIKTILKDEIFDVFAVSETWLNNSVSNRAIDIPGYTFCRSDRPSRGGGVGIFVSKKLKFKSIFRTCVAELCESLFIELYFDSIKILLGVVYLPNGNLSGFEERHRNIFLKYSNVIVCGDFNCNLFNSSKSNLMRSLCLRLNLSMVHNSLPTHYDLANDSTSLLDYFLVSDISMIKFSNQVQCPSISDHALIFACFTFNVEPIQEYIEYRDYNNINWYELFSRLSNFDINLFFNSPDVDAKCSLIASLFTDLFSCVPVVRKRVCNYDDAWMRSSDVALARSLRDMAYSTYRVNRSVENWRLYCRLRNKAKGVIRREKRRHFSRLFWGLDTAGLWKALRNSGCVGDSSDLAWDGDVDILNSFFVGENNTYDQPILDFEEFVDSVDCFSFRCVSEVDVMEALNKVMSKSIGIDGIPIRFIKLIFPHISCILLNVINCILTTSVFPVFWKTARVVPIPKTKIVHDLDDLRPISILPALSKIVEHLIKNQIIQSASVNIYESQYAFRRGYSTTSLLLKLTDSIRENLNMNKLSALISLDLSKAFNSISHVSMIQKLRDYFNFSTSACKLVLSYLSGRSQFVDLKGVRSGLLSLHSGVPQGSVLGPLLFILYVNDIYLQTNSRICQTFLFADDIFLLYKGNRTFSEAFESDINCCLDRVLQWTLENSLTINPSKTKAIMFGTSNHFFPDINLFLGDTVIECVSEHKCLGVTLDGKLSFKHHIDLLSGKVWGALRRIYSSNVYLPFRIKRRLAHGLLVPHILYGLEVISGSSSVAFSKLKRIVNTIVRFVYSVRRWDHISTYVHRFLGCSFENFVKYRNLLLFHRVIKSGVPSPLCSTFVFLRSSRNPQIFIPRIFKLIFERSFLVRIARCWNCLPYELRIFSHSNNVFRLKMLSYLGDLF